MDLNANNNPIEPLSTKTVVLLLLDGWGVAPASEANAFTSAKTAVFNKLIKEYPVALLSVPAININARYLNIGLGREVEDEKTVDENTLTKIVADKNLKQIKITETERLAALTHYFNGHNENKFNGEDWKIVSSELSDHSVKPFRVSRGIIRELNKALKLEKYSLLIVSMPVIDLVAGTGDLNTVKQAIESLDKNLKKIVDIVLDKKAVLIISSVCGNAENIENMATELVNKEMTNNPVPLIIIGEDFKGKTIGLSEPLNEDLSLLAPAGSLSDLAPTILDIMNIEKPESMSGESLIDNNKNKE